MKLPPIQTSQTNLKAGLQLARKAFLNNQEWMGKFAEHQNQHQYPKQQKKISKASQVLLSSILKMKSTKQVCGLCLIQKPKSEMENLCKCDHKYCYSCLNSYAITQIEQLIPVKCPQQQCKYTMTLTSNVYRYLPTEIKLKYLQNKHAFLIDKKDWENRCQRCLRQRHKGQCKFSLNPQVIQNSFQFRVCNKCKVQIRLTSGKRKVICTKCNQAMCYLCGVPWTDNHECDQKDNVRKLQKMNGYHGCCQCCQCCTYGCENNCVSCGDCCCRSCGDCCTSDFCCQVLFSCNECNPGCVIWNICSIPIRILLTLVFTCLYLGIFMILLTFCAIWVCICLLVAVLFHSWVVILQSSCPITIFAIIFYPITVFYAAGVIIMETSEVPVTCFGEILEAYCEAIPNIWINISPAKCQC